MKRISAGILAHVDAGKTTLSEGLLYCAGEIRKLGRVDSQNTFLDTNEIERQRGITIFSKQAVLNMENATITLLDTPGHVDFAAEAERTLSVLDYAILVISATDGIQSHTKTLWSYLTKHNVPVFIFINKLDLTGADKDAVIEELKCEFGGNFIDFSEKSSDFNEELATCDEKILDEFLTTGKVRIDAVKSAIRKRNLFPCFSGAALKMEGVKEFLESFAELTMQKNMPEKFGAKAFKISQDERGSRLTFLKITGGSLKVKATVETDGNQEKVNEIRIYSGDKYKNVDEAFAGDVCAVTGLKSISAGDGLGFEENAQSLLSEPIFNYRVILPNGTDVQTAMEKLKQLGDEETQLNIEWNEHLKEIQLRIMGEIQLEVLKQLILKRFDMEVQFEQGRIVYKETIENTVEGVGHYEPLRHYAEVHLVLSPLPRGTGMQFETDCPESVLDKNWQRLVLTHLCEKNHIGVLTGSPITDMKITLKSGAAHLKHTEGGDFRQATYRAVRHGLRRAKSVLLEPYYDFVIDIPVENVGRAMTDLDIVGAEFSLSHPNGDMTKITGRAPAEAISSYQREITSYTHGKGRISCNFSGYDVCKNADEVIRKIDYNCDADIENTADSVFCAKGAGFNVKWDEVVDYMHLESVLKPKKQLKENETVKRSGNIFASDDELLKIFESTYGKVETKLPTRAMHTVKDTIKSPTTKKIRKKHEKDYLLVDGYNIIFAWDDLKKLASDKLELARHRLIERMSVYKVFKQCEVIVVFDAYKVKGNRGEVERENGVTIVYTKESQTADAYIEKATKELTKNYNVTVATSDGVEQLIIFGTGAYRLPAGLLEDEMLKVEASVRDMIEDNNLKEDSSVRLTEWHKRNISEK